MKKIIWWFWWLRTKDSEKVLAAQATAQYLEYLTQFRSLSGDTPKTLDEAITFLREEKCETEHGAWWFERILPIALRQLRHKPKDLQAAKSLL